MAVIRRRYTEGYHLQSGALFRRSAFVYRKRNTPLSKRKLKRHVESIAGWGSSFPYWGAIAALEAQAFKAGADDAMHGREPRVDRIFALQRFA